MNRTDIYQSITDKIVKKLESGIIPWRKSWRSGIPRNFASKRPYSGINFLSLLAEDHKSPYYLTFLQCKERGGQILDGSKGSLIVFGKCTYSQIQMNPSQQPKFLF
jgi:antirestriction protein ArdC